MSILLCKFCNSGKYVKNGSVYKKQRYKCKDCKRNFIEGDERQKYTQADHLKVIKLYLENCGIRSIERLTGIRNSQISKWIENIADYVKNEFDRTRSNINCKRLRKAVLTKLDYIKFRFHGSKSEILLEL